MNKTEKPYSEETRAVEPTRKLKNKCLKQCKTG